MRRLFILFFIIFVNQSFSQTIFRYIKKDDFQAVKNCTDSVNLRDNKKATPLMWAIFRSDLKMVKLLISRGADPKLKGCITFQDSESNTEFIYGSCLTIAAGENKIDILKYLLRKQRISVEDKEYNMFENIENGWNALQWASVKGNLEVIKYLVRKGANINSVAETDNNKTSLIFALNFDRKEAVRLLVELGADLNKPDMSGSTPLDYAVELDDRELTGYLYKKGARFSEKRQKEFVKRLLNKYKIKSLAEL